MKANPINGWIEIGLGDSVQVLSSALDLGGGSMIVGGGSVIPEPSGGMLLVLGLAVLTLRRRDYRDGKGNVIR